MNVTEALDVGCAFEGECVAVRVDMCRCFGKS